MELRAYRAYKEPELPITFWRTSTGQEVDFILGDKEAALEIKGSKMVHEKDIYPLKALIEDGPVKKCLVVSLENEPRTIAKDIKIVPWRMFLEMLWSGSLI